MPRFILYTENTRYVLYNVLYMYHNLLYNITWYNGIPCISRTNINYLIIAQTRKQPIS